MYLYVNYGADIDAIRDKFMAVAKSHKFSDSDVEPEFLVYDMTEETIKLRTKVTSDSPANAWALECDLREAMLKFLAEQQWEHLPTERVTFVTRDLDPEARHGGKKESTADELLEKQKESRENFES